MADIKYVNMDASSSEPALGRTLSIKVSLKVKASTFVYVFLVPGKKNINPLKINSSDRAGIDSPGLEKQGVISGSNGEVTFDLILSNYGGDEFTVKVAEDKSGTKGVIELGTTYVVWKKLYYQTSKMKSSFDFPFNKVVEEYEKHFIELEATSKIEVPHKENLETRELQTYSAHFKKEKSPFEAHIVLIDRQCDSRTIYLSNTVTEQVTFIEQSHSDWPFTDWLIDSNGFDATGKQAVVKVIKKTVAGKKGIEVDLNGSGLDATKSEVDLDIAYKSLKGEYTGDATYKPNVFIAVGNPRSDESKSKTVSHEIGQEKKETIKEKTEKK